MKYLITGAAGFIGSTLAASLTSQGHSVVGLDDLSNGTLANLPNSPLFDFHKIDIRSRQSRDLYRNIDCVIHLAAISSLPECQSEPFEAYSVNVSGTAEVLESSRLANVKRVIFASTSAVYENSNKGVFLESQQNRPDLVYSHTKKASEEVCENYSTNYGMNVSVIRFFNVYGPHQNYHRKSPPLLGYIANCVKENRSPSFHSDGEQKRDYIYIDDIVSLLTTVSQKSMSKFEIINACSGKLSSVKEIYEIVKLLKPEAKDPKYRKSTDFWNNYPELIQGDFPLSRERIAREVNKHSEGSNHFAMKNYEWEPTVELDEGIRRIFAFLNKTLNTRD
jgi:UDP-glucose 4-epimerase